VRRLIAFTFALCSTSIVSAQQSAPAAATNASSSHRGLIKQYCLGCHNEKLKTGGIALDALDLSNVGTSANSWEKVLRKVRTGEMPPPGLPRPNATTTASFTASLEQALDRAAAAKPNPGRPAVHRLNRAEYSNVVRDLFALDINAGSLLPVDDSGYGFDNIADVLSFSPALLERYMSAARWVSSLAVGDLKTQVAEEQFAPLRDPPSDFRRPSRTERVSYDLPFNSRGGLSVQHYFPLDAEYIFRVKVSGNNFPGVTPPLYELRIPVKAGLHTIGVTFMRESPKPEVETPGMRGAPQYAGGAPPAARFPAEMDLRLDGARLKRFEVPQRGGARPDVTTLTLAGPYNTTGRGDTPSRSRVFVCRPATPKEEEPCARTILTTLARRAFRRPVTDADVKPLLSFYERGRKEGDFDDGVQKAISAMLMSPDFLFRIEQDPPGAAPATVYRIGDYELASRLSFFFWSSIPDDELLALAGDGKLKDPAILRQQVNRMLEDRRSQAIVSNFAGQWLQLRNLATVKPDPQAFSYFDESLRRSFQQETEMFFASILRENRSVLELLDADYTFLNERLAEHYDVPRVYGSHFRKVNVKNPNRGGLLGQGSILTVTSYPNRTSVVQRGKWILENLLGTPPPPPPADVPELKPHANDGRLLTMREQLEQHRTNPTCASCHARMDPIGFALENYDAVGKWRAKDGGSAIDATGKLPDGTTFEGPAGLTKLLAASYRDDFVTTVTEKLLIYALGRGLEGYDRPTIRAIMRKAAADNYRLPALIAAVVESKPFQMRRTAEP
jgi:hypothetical protein